MKHRAMPKILLICVWSGPVVAAAILLVAKNDAIMAAFVALSGLVYAALLHWYLTVSDRVNLSYRLRARVEK
jgi:hypothetical protein